jgi:type II secretory pathway pseudopilin PulG
MVFNPKYIGVTLTLVGMALELYWGLSLNHLLAVGLSVIGLALYAHGQGFHPAWGALALLPLAGPIAGLIELTESSRMDTITPRKKYWGLGLILLGAGLWVAFYALTPWPLAEADFWGSVVASVLTVNMVFFPVLPVIGLTLYATARGKSYGVCYWGLIPIVGGVMGLCVVPFTAKTEFPSVNWREVGVATGLINLVGVFVAVALPGFLSYQGKARQAEARTNLGGLYVSETVFHEEKRRYGTFEEIGFTLGGTLSGTCNTCRYTYRIDTSGKPGTVISAGVGPGATPDNTKISAGYNATGFTATATGNIDDDPTLDQWHVNDQKQGLDKADVNDATN